MLSFVRFSCFVVLAGCGPAITVDRETEGASGPETTDPQTSIDSSASGQPPTIGTSAGTTVGTTAGPVTSVTDASTTTDSFESSSTGPVECPGGDKLGDACTPFGGECPACFKCMPWSTDGPSWDLNNCSPVVPDPNAAGELCTAEGGGTSGFDSCDATSMCWNVDPLTEMGTCVPFCVGTMEAPSCANESEHCIIANDGVLAFCTPICDPLAQSACPENEVCGADPGDPPVCFPGTGNAQYGDPCEFVNSCDAGMFCGDDNDTLGCAGPACCSVFCDVNVGDCPEMAQECVPWFAVGEAPPDLDHLGGCRVP